MPQRGDVIKASDVLLTSGGTISGNLTISGTLDVGTVIKLGNPSSPGNNRLTIKQSSSNSGYGIRIENADNSKAAEIWVGSGGLAIDATGTSNLHLRTASQDRLYISNNGNVGIGTTSPAQKLHVVGDAHIDGKITANNLQVKVQNSQAVIFGTDDGTNGNFRFLIKNQDGYHYLQVGTSSSDSSAKLRFSRFGTNQNLAEVEFIANNVKINGNTVWHAGNDGAGSGLDADTLDGYQTTTAGGTEATRVAVTDSNGRVGDANKLGGYNASDYPRKGENASVTATWTFTNDVIHNSSTNSKYFYFTRNGSTTNEFLRVGVDDYGAILYAKQDEATCRIKFDLEATDTESSNGANANSGSIIFETTKTGGRKILIDGNQVWHAGNDGAGSGLDADLLDGYQTTSPGGTEATRVAVTDSNGRVGDSAKLGGVAASSYARKNVAETIAANWTIGDNNQRVLKCRAITLAIDTRTVTLSYDANGRLTSVTEKDGTTTVKTTTLTYDANGNLTQVQESAGGTTVTTTLSYTNGQLTSISKTVT